MACAARGAVEREVPGGEREEWPRRRPHLSDHHTRHPHQKRATERTLNAYHITWHFITVTVTLHNMAVHFHIRASLSRFVH